MPLDTFIISHIGHLNHRRNLESLIPLQKTGYQVVIIGSSSTPKDSSESSSLKQKLISKGIIIIDKYIENIEEIYQLSDLYIFPVIEDCGSIGLPLSILEARACGIPVLTTNFGSTKQYLENDYGNIIYSDPDYFLQHILKIESVYLNNIQTNISRLNELYNQIIFEEIDN